MEDRAGQSEAWLRSSRCAGGGSHSPGPENRDDAQEDIGAVTTILIGGDFSVGLLHSPLE